MEFFQIFRFGGTIAVNRLSVRDMVAVGFMTLILYLILLALISLILPTLLLGLYIIWMFTNDGYGGDYNIKQRLTLNIMTVMAVVYYMLDFHFGWISYHILGDAIGKEGLDAVASFNLTIGVLSIILFFVGHELYRLGENHLLRVIIFSAIIFFGFKMVRPIARSVVSNAITQSTATLDIPLTQEEIEQDEELRQWEEDYKNGKIVNFNR